MNVGLIYNFLKIGLHVFRRKVWFDMCIFLVNFFTINQTMIKINANQINDKTKILT